MTTESDTRPESADEAVSYPATDHPAWELRGVVVRYDHRPDRRTVCPRSPAPEQLTTAWLTADASASYDLEEAR